MMTDEVLFEALEATWPPLSKTVQDGLILRDGAGGGKRVSAATLSSDDPEILQRAGSLPSLFQLREGQTMADRYLSERSYAIVDPTLIYQMPIDPDDIPDIPPVTTFEIWPPLQAMVELWREGGIDRARLDVMDRAQGAKTGILGRIDNRVGGTGFVAIHKSTAMLHALETHEDHRRKGLGRFMTRAALAWAAKNGAAFFALAVTEQNVAAQKLYSSLGMRTVARYHYRQKT